MTLAPAAPQAPVPGLEPLVLPPGLKLSPEQFALVCEANPEAVLELTADLATGGWPCGAGGDGADRGGRGAGRGRTAAGAAAGAGGDLGGLELPCQRACIMGLGHGRHQPRRLHPERGGPLASSSGPSRGWPGTWPWGRVLNRLYLWSWPWRQLKRTTSRQALPESGLSTRPGPCSAAFHQRGFVGQEPQGRSAALGPGPGAWASEGLPDRSQRREPRHGAS